MHVILRQITFFGNVLVREGEAHTVQAQHPHPKGVMMTGTDGVGHIVEASCTGRAQRALRLGLGVIVTVCGHRRAVTTWTMHTVWPA